MVVIKADLNYIDDILKIENESFIDPLKKEDLIYEINDNPFSNFLLLKNDENKIVGYYTLDGCRLAEPQSGINIVKYANGKTAKIVVKH